MLWPHSSGFPGRSRGQGLRQPREPREFAAQLFGSPNVTLFVTGEHNRTLGRAQVAGRTLGALAQASPASRRTTPGPRVRRSRASFSSETVGP